MNVHQVNGYGLYALKIFNQEYRRLQAEVDRLTSKAEKLVEEDKVDEAEKILSRPAIKLFEAVRFVTLGQVPIDPNSANFRLGKTLGKGYTSWRRVKKMSLPDRYRLFFRFTSTPPKSIVYAWLNDESTQRKAGSKTDVYNVFKGLLGKGEIPNSWDELIAAATPLNA
ncbi:type II toxin-antitoxin system YhaV family toxin [Photobacterium sp. 53610]|uniref:type II toxin-antitoxin system YhaV family toxin n=1 Tax=Photobacterium sp. 53610 TaxID=3102789 RepID=UPI002ED89E71